MELIQSLLDTKWIGFHVGTIILRNFKYLEDINIILNLKFIFPRIKVTWADGIVVYQMP